MKLGELRGKMRESERFKKSLSDIRSIAKPALITVAIVAGVVGAIALAIVLTREEDIPDFLKRWEQIVESGDVQAYEEICSEEFKEKDSYEETKKLIAENEIDASIDDKDIEEVRLDDNHYVIKHIPVSLSKGNVQTHQELYIKRRGLISPRWEIDRAGYHFSKKAGEKLKEIVEHKPAEALAEPNETPRDTEFVIRQTLEVWRRAWENKELDEYMDCYADYADITRVTVVGGKERQTRLSKNELRKHVERLNRKYGRIKVAIWQPVKIQGDTATAKANFLQEYSAWGHSAAKAPVYRDIGTKELQFVKHDVEWKITNENWTLYKDVPVYPEREL